MGRIGTIVLALLFSVTGVASQEVLPPEVGLTWDTPYPPEWVTCDEYDCCTLETGRPAVKYVLRWRLVGTSFSGNEIEFDLFYPPVDHPDGSGNPCFRRVKVITPSRFYTIDNGTLVIFALWGKNVETGEESDPSNEVSVYWPWVCAGSTRQELIDCVLACKAAMGSIWCEE
jgi:hypothetical protein